MSLNKNWLLALFILLIASVFRFYDLKNAPPGLYPDEAMNGNNALEAIRTGSYKIFYPENNGREGLFINLQAILLKATRLKEPWVLRLPSAIFGVLTVAGLLLLAKTLFKNYLVALLSSFFLATNFWHINFSRIGFRAIMAPFFLTWAAYFLLRAFEKKKYLVPAIVGGLFYGLGFYSYIAYRATPLIILAIFLWFLFKFEDRKKIWRIAITFSAAAIFIALPLIGYFFQNPQDFFGRTTQISVFSSETALKDFGMNILKTAGMFNVSGDWNWRHNIAGAPLLFWPVGILFIIGLGIGTKMFLEKASRSSSGHGSSEARERERESSGDFPAGKINRVFREEYFQAIMVLFIWLIVAALPVIVSNEGIPHALRSLLMVPPVFMLAGYGGATVYQFFENKKIQRHLIYTFYGLFFFILIFEAYYSYFIYWGGRREVANAFAEDYVQTGRLLNSLPENMPKYVIIETGGVGVRGIPMPAQTIMFLTDTFLPEGQKEKNIHYVLKERPDEIPPGSFVVTIK